MIKLVIITPTTISSFSDVLFDTILHEAFYLRPKIKLLMVFLR